MVSALLLLLIAVTAWFSLRSSLLVTLALALQLTQMMTASHFGVGQTWGPNSRTSTNFGDLKEYHPIIHPIKKWRNCPAMLASTQRVQTHDPPKKWKQWPLNSDQSSGFRIPKWTDRIRRPVGPPTTGFLESLPAARRCPARPDLRGTWGTGRDSEPQWNTFNLVFFKTNPSDPNFEYLKFYEYLDLLVEFLWISYNPIPILNIYVIYETISNQGPGPNRIDPILNQMAFFL